MIKVAICADCGEMKWIEPNRPFIPLSKCDNCGSRNMQLIDEEVVPIIDNLRMRSIFTDASCAGHVVYVPHKHAYGQYGYGYILFAGTHNGYHFNTFRHEDEPEEDNIFSEFRKIFEAINNESEYKFEMVLNEIMYQFKSKIDHIKYQDDETVYTRASINIEVKKDQWGEDPYDIKIGFLHIWKWLSNFVELCMKTDTETQFKLCGLSHNLIPEWVEGVAPVTKRRNLSRPKEDAEKQ